MDNESSATPSNHSQLLRSCLDQCLVFITTQCGDMFDQVKPILMEYASKAETNVAQGRFFDAINTIAPQRDQIESDFRKQIHKGFDEFIGGKAIQYPPSLIESDEGEQLSMVEEDTLEIHLALQSMIANTNSDCRQELYGLGKRFAILHGGKQVKEHEIPGCPTHIAISFYKAVENIGLEKDMMLILLFLFGKHVMGDANSIYQHLNNFLIEAGIFPNLKLSPNRAEADARPLPPKIQMPYTTPGQETSTVPSGAMGNRQSTGNNPTLQQAVETLTSATSGEPDTLTTGHMHLAVAQQMFNSINRMLESQRQQNPAYSAHPESLPGSDLSQLRDTGELVEAIDGIEHTRQESVFQAPDAKGNLPQQVQLDPDLLLRVKEALISEKEKLYQELDRNTIPSADLDTIELVGMLFEEVLNEDQLPNIAKALISHLHTPYLKVAVQDHSFMINHEHAARKLLDLMIKSGQRWIDEEQLRRGIYYPMQDAVNTIMTEYRDDVELFNSVHDKLAQQVRDLEEKAKLLEQRNHEAARGRERLESARQQARAIVKEHIGTAELHSILERFLNSAWLDRLILMLLRDPNITESKEWGSAIKVIDAIVRINEAPNNRKVQNWLGANQAGIKHRITQGLATLGDHHRATCNALFQFIDNCLEKQDATADEVAKGIPVSPDHSHVAPEKSEHQQPDPLNTEEKQQLHELQKLAFGTWFEITDKDNEIKKLKLSWFSPLTHKYMFVDRFGAQAYVTPVEDLARDMLSGKAKVIKQAKLAFVDRALKKIHSILERALGLQHSTSQEQ